MKKAISARQADTSGEESCRVFARNLEEDGVPWISAIGSKVYCRSARKPFVHRHAGCVEVIYCRRGICEYSSLGKAYRLMPGQLFVSRPDEPHEMLSDPTGQAVYCLLFRSCGKRALGMDARSLHFIEKKLWALPRVLEGDRAVGASFAHLIRVVGRDFEDVVERRVRVRAACMNLLLSIVDASKRTLVPCKSGRIRALADEMREHPERQYPIEDLAERVGFSSSSLLNGFKATVGLPPHAYLLKCRIDRAKRLLRAGSMRITEISYALGFPSSQHFAAQFRKTAGMSPREWAQSGCA